MTVNLPPNNSGQTGITIPPIGQPSSGNITIPSVTPPVINQQPLHNPQFPLYEREIEVPIKKPPEPVLTPQAEQSYQTPRPTYNVPPQINNEEQVEHKNMTPQGYTLTGANAQVHIHNYASAENKVSENVNSGLSISAILGVTSLENLDSTLDQLHYAIKVAEAKKVLFEAQSKLDAGLIK